MVVGETHHFRKPPIFGTQASWLVILATWMAKMDGSAWDQRWSDQWVDIYPARNILFISIGSIGCNNPLVLTIDPNFLGSSAQTSLWDWLFQLFLVTNICRFLKVSFSAEATPHITLLLPCKSKSTTRKIAFHQRLFLSREFESSKIGVCIIS